MIEVSIDTDNTRPKAEDGTWYGSEKGGSVEVSYHVKINKGKRYAQ